MKTGMKLLVLAFCMGMVFWGMGLSVSSAAQAGAKIVKIEGADFSVVKSMAENIAVFKGKQVTVTLGSGESITGKVVDVNSKYLHLGELDRSNFMDAFIDVSHIGAIKAQTRKYSNE
jgi:hypothetical protein